MVYAKILKYNDTIIKPRRKPRILGLFYVNEKANNIFSVARVSMNKKERNNSLHKLYNLGYLDATKYSGFLIKYIYETSSTIFEVTDYDNIVLYYQREHGEKIVGCYLAENYF